MTPLKVFILEDNPQRKAWFWHRFEHHDLTLIDSCTLIHRFEGPYDLILLDHDLGGRQMTWHEDSGFSFVIGMKDKFEEALVVIHSYNDPGARAMKGEFPAAIIAPFGGKKFLTIIDALLMGYEGWKV